MHSLSVHPKSYTGRSLMIEMRSMVGRSMDIVVASYILALQSPGGSSVAMFKSSPSHRWRPNSTTDPQRWLKVCSNDAYPFVLNMATKLPPGDCKAKEPQLYPYCFRPKPWCICLTTSLSFDSAFCNIFGVQKGNASFEHTFNPRWGSVVLLGSHLWLGLLLNMATELPPGDCKAKE